MRRLSAIRHTHQLSNSNATRVDIQWMRALAVGLVLLFHLWPNRVVGGFVGVDIFFVISGFLITSHLLNKPPKTFRDVADSGQNNSRLKAISS